ncbi:MAG: hypothetical protein JW717_14575 [Marinilabiliaceae bacterium]|nr:hypothetical protein [Marinilabiliaceae bacterium]
MTQFIKKVILFIIAFFIFDKIFYIFLFISPKLEVDKRLEYLVNGKINKDVVIIGSSRGARDVIAKQIEDSINVSAYNLSYPGSDIEFHEFLLKTLIKYNSKPKAVILVLDDSSELLPDETINFRLDRLYPLARYNYINNEMIKRGEKNFSSRFLVLSRINKRNFDMSQKYFTHLDSIKDCGSMPISFQREGSKEFEYSNVSVYDETLEVPVKVESFLSFQQICIDNDIKLYLVFPPNYKAHNQLFENRIRKLAQPNVSLLIHDTINESYRNQMFYYDELHLKNNGAVIFTNEIIDMLKSEKSKRKVL